MNPDAVILVTGAARRVGAAIARCLHACGATLVLHYRNSATEAEALAAEFNGQRPGSALTLSADLVDAGQCARLIDAIGDRLGRLDGLVNNASTFFATPLGGIDEQAWEALIGSNLKGPLFLCQAAAPLLRRQRGAIVNITDVHAERPLRNYPLYCAAKAGLLGLTRALAVDLAPAVRVNAVAPGPIAWPEQGEDFPEADRQAIVAHTLLQRTGNPQDIAGAVRYLMFEAPYVTGQVINVDGGRTAHL